MDDSIGHFKLPAKERWHGKSESSELGNLSRVDSPVETHLSVESNLVSPADQPEPLAALVVGRPVVRTGVSLVGSRSICLAELTLRDVLAAVSFAPISD